MIRTKTSLAILITAAVGLASAGLLGQTAPTTVRVPEGTRPASIQGWIKLVLK
jgi:hypothetical protein